MGDVVKFNGISRLKLNPNVVLGEAIGNVKDVVVIGFDNDDEFYFSSSEPDGSDVLWLIERARHKLMMITDDIEDGK